MGKTDAQAKLAALIWEWDPIGVADVAPADEYDCLIMPLMGMLSRGAGAAEVRQYLWDELEDHFGLDPALLDVDAVASKLTTWWSYH